MEEPGWRPLHVSLRPSACTAFDTASELLFVGDLHGGIASLFCHDYSRYTAYRAHMLGHATTLLADDKGIFSLGVDSVKCANRRGLAQWNLQAPLGGFTSMTWSSARNSDLIVASAVNNGLGTQPDLLCVNAATGTVIRKADSKGPISHLTKTSQYVVTGSLSGSISIRDPRTLSQEHTVQGHPGGLIALEGEGNLLCSIGYTVMQGRPVPEQLVKTWDIRALRPLMPINVPGGPALVKAHPRMPQTVFIASQQGQFQIVDINNPGSMSYYQLETSGYITSMAIAPTGEGIALTDSDGLLHVWGTGDASQVHFSRGTEEIVLPDPVERPKQIHWTDKTPLNMIGMPHYTTPLLSNIPYSDWITPYTPIFTPQKKVDPSVLKSMRTVDFVGYAVNPRTDKYRNQATKASDHRKADKRRMDVPQFRSQKARKGQTEEQQDSAEEVVVQAKEEVLKWYRRVEIKYSKFGVEDFDFGFYNKTRYSGLETHIANSYANSLLQLLRACSPIRKVAEAHTFDVCTKENCLLCEAGFLFKMLQDAKGSNCQATNFSRAFSATSQASVLGLMDADDASPSVSYSSLIQTFNQFLLDHMAVEAGSTSTSNPRLRTDLPTRDPAPSVLEQLCGMHLTTSSTCPHCGHQISRDSIKSVLDLLYPRKPLSNEAPPPSDFFSILKLSIGRETTNRTLCVKCGHSAHLRVRRTIQQPLSTSLPAVLAINAGVKSADHLSMWQDAPDGSRFLQDRFSVVTDPSGALAFRPESSEVAAVTYELQGMVCQIQAEGEASHLIALAKMPSVDHNQWVLFNDFLVRQVSQDEALSVVGAWKIPAVVYYQRVDARQLLNFDALPQAADPSILTLDSTIARRRDPSRLAHTPLAPDEIPRKGTLIAIDAEFVSLQQEEAEVHSNGTRRVIRPSRMTLARVSVLRGEGTKTGMPFIDDYIHTSDPVEDYLTEFSGILPGDLDPMVSKHTLVPLKVAYKKLRLLVDLGCVFIGHGLNKDFRIINIFVPPSQIIDTVNIYHLPARHRKLSLRFLSWVVLQQDIQSSGTHDSIEDARTALQLFEQYQRMDVEGVFDEELEEIYREGTKLGFKVPGVTADKSPQPPFAEILPAVHP